MQQGNYLKKTAEIEIMFEGELGKQIRKLPEIERRHNLSKKDFEENYLKKHIPVILTGLTDNWLASKEWDLDFFGSKYGDIEVLTNLYDTKKISKETLSAFINRLKSRTPSDDPIYLQEWVFQCDAPDLKDYYKTPEHFIDSWMRKLYGFDYSTLWIGSAGSKTFLHQDAVHVNIWIAQLYGEKEWFLFDKKAHFPINQEGKPEIDKFLTDADTKAMHAVVKPGDILFVPYKWWHRAQAVTDSMSINTFFLTEEITPQFVKEYMAIPLVLALEGEALKEQYEMRYNISKMRVEIQSKLMNISPKSILGVEA